MKVILKEEVRALGASGAVVDVSDGYARNFLLPRNKAVLATPAAVKVAEAEQRRAQAQQTQVEADAQQWAERLQALTVTIPVQAGEGEKLFGAVTAKDIAAALAQAGMPVDKRMVELEAPIKQLGEVTVTIRLRSTVSAPLRVSVVAEGAAEAAPKKSRKQKSA